MLDVRGEVLRSLDDWLGLRRNQERRGIEDPNRVGNGILGSAELRDKVVGTYEAAGFPRYRMVQDGYPETTDVDRRMLIGYGANADRYETWQTSEKPTAMHA